jgi:SEC-C motif-containing protein
MTACPCGSGLTEVACCGPIVAGEPAATAVALMRSRYTAYVRGAIDHVAATTDPTTRGELDRDAALRWSRETVWLGLEIVATERGVAGDLEGTVEFIARGVTRGTAFTQHERSRFRHHEGRWYYVAGELVRAQPAAARPASVGRNDACPCGSGLKFKRCHGA